MNKTALYAILLAAIFPLLCYFVIKHFSEETILMPRHYVVDSVSTKTRNGKAYSDTAWQRLHDIKMTNQMGMPVTWDSLRGKVIVADFFFTHCPNICPAMTSNMRKLEESITNAQRVGDKTPKFLHFVSFSIDPERDSVPRLKYWADRFQINPERWWLLTGKKEEIYGLNKQLMLSVEDGLGVDSDFQHTDHFILIDSTLHVRGYYHGLDTNALAKLSNDIILLSMEKDPKRKSIFAGELPVIAVAFLCAFIGVGALLYFLDKKKKDANSSLAKK